MPCDNTSKVKSNEIAFYRLKASIRSQYISWQSLYPEYLKPPYKKYLQYVQSIKKDNMKVLDLCCGMGEFTFDIAKITKGEVLAVDISPESIRICQEHLLETPGLNIAFRTSDVESLELVPQSYDLICMSGSLSYLNVGRLLQCIKSWLKPDGSFIVVDTYGYNPIFNLKRKLNFIFKKTTKQTVLGIPKKEELEAISSCFKKVDIEYFGIFAFIGPFLKYVVGESLTAKIIDGLDKYFPFLKKYSFKFVLRARDEILK